MKTLFAGLARAALAAGCNQAAPTTAPKGNETDIRIRTPGAKVDVQGDGKGVDVDVERKKKNP